MTIRSARSQSGIPVATPRLEMSEDTHPLLVLQANARFRPFTTWFTIVSFDDMPISDGDTIKIPISDLYCEMV